MNDELVMLDNPIWSALTSDNATLGIGTDQVRLFDSAVAPFAGLKADTPENFLALFDLVAEQRVVVLFSPKFDLNPSPFEVVVKIPGHQMIFEGELPGAGLENELIQLSDKDIPEMLRLTRLAQPGPFAERTVDFGGYRGIFDEGRLVAMGGQRLKGHRHTEISAVCSHPDHNGKGYGRRIMYALIRDIANTGNIPYLHVRADNTRAKTLYLRMGFAIRSEMNFYVLQKPSIGRVN